MTAASAIRAGMATENGGFTITVPSGNGAWERRRYGRTPDSMFWDVRGLDEAISGTREKRGESQAFSPLLIL
jgi:hypothetical protein